MTAPLMQPQQEGGRAMCWPLSVRGDAGNCSIGASDNANAQIVIPPDPDRGAIISELVWSYSNTPTGGRLTIASGNGGTFLDIDITAGGPGFIPLDPPVNLDKNDSASITLYAAGAGVTGKVMANCWRMT